MKEQDVLEQNVSSLIEKGGEPPRLGDAARTRMRAELIAKYGAPETARTRVRVPLGAIALGLAATAALALIV